MASWSTFPDLGRELEPAAIAIRSSTTVLKGRPFVICLNDRTACRVDILNVTMSEGRKGERLEASTQQQTRYPTERRQRDCDG